MGSVRERPEIDETPRWQIVTWGLVQVGVGIWFFGQAVSAARWGKESLSGWPWWLALIVGAVFFFPGLWRIAPDRRWINLAAAIAQMLLAALCGVGAVIGTIFDVMSNRGYFFFYTLPGVVLLLSVGAISAILGFRRLT